MPQELMICGVMGTVLAIGAFGGAVRETFILNALRNMYNSTVDEPIPEQILLVVESLGGDDNGDGSL